MENSTCPTNLTEESAIEMSLSSIYSSQDVAEIMRINNQRGGACENDSDRAQARKLFMIFAGAIFSIIMAIQYILKNEEESKSSMMENGLSGIVVIPITGNKKIDKAIALLDKAVYGIPPFVLAIITCLSDKIGGIYTNISQHTPELKQRVAVYILELYESSGAGLLWNVSIGGLASGFKNYIMNASPTEYDIIFVGIENVLCDFIAAYSKPLGGSKKHKKSKKYKKKSRKHRKTKKYKKNKK
jgi:hypothetical protein